MLVLPTAPSPRRRTLRLTWSSTMATPSHARAALITLAGSMSALRRRGSVRVQPEAGPDEPLRDCVGLGEERDVAVPLREGVCVRPLELPHRELQLPGEPVHVAAFDHRRKDRMLASDHDDLSLPEPELLERPATIVERVATNSWRMISMPLMMSLSCTMPCLRDQWRISMPLSCIRYNSSSRARRIAYSPIPRTPAPPRPAAAAAPRFREG